MIVSKGRIKNVSEKIHWLEKGMGAGGPLIRNRFGHDQENVGRHRKPKGLLWPRSPARAGPARQDKMGKDQKYMKQAGY